MNTNQTQPMLPTTMIPPAQLWLGNHDELAAALIEYLQKILCPSHGCTLCSTCHAIRMQQHYAITWLLPEKQYTLDQLSVISSTIAFALEDDAHHFFIIQKADALTPSCSNSLLKSIEEPPHGYHFILLTERPDELLPTIKSRCVVYSWYTETNSIKHKNLFAFLSTVNPINPAAFLKELESAKINERETVELLDALLLHWITVSKKAVLNQDAKLYQQAVRVIEELKKALLIPPMPGSSNLLLKDLVLRVKKT